MKKKKKKRKENYNKSSRIVRINIIYRVMDRLKIITKNHLRLFLRLFEFLEFNDIINSNYVQC